jgi:probable rRNA maturation factor
VASGTRPPQPSRSVAILNRHPRLRVDRRALIRVLRLLDANHDGLSTSRSSLGNGELSVVFLTDPALARLHGRFLSDPSPTDVITFPGEPALGAAGEICVSADAAARFADGNRRNFSEELTLYVVHGWLHLAGHDDLSAGVRRAMRRAEARAMRALSAAGAVPTFAWA